MVFNCFVDARLDSLIQTDIYLINEWPKYSKRCCII